MKTTLSFLLSLLGLITLMGCVTLAHPQYAPGVLHVIGGVDDYLSAVGAYDYGISKEELERRLSSPPLASCVSGHYELSETTLPNKTRVRLPVDGPYYSVAYVTPMGEVRPIGLIFLSDHGIMKYRINVMDKKLGYTLRLLVGAPEAIKAAHAIEYKDQRLFAELYWRNERAFKAFLKEPHTWPEFQAFMKKLKASNPPEAASLWRIKEATWNNAKDLDANSAFRAEAYPGGLIQCVESRIHWDRIMAVLLDDVYCNYFSDGRPIASAFPAKPSDWNLYHVFANIYLDGDRVVAVILSESTWYDCDPCTSLLAKDGPVGIDWYSHRQFKIWYLPEDESKDGTVQQNSP
jgi:hypothetical protein